MKLQRLALLGVLWAFSKTFAAPPQAIPIQHPNVHQFNHRLRVQMVLIQEGIKKGKITRDQAVAFRADLKAARSKEMTFIKLDGPSDLNPSQQNELNGMLDKDSQALGETK